MRHQPASLLLLLSLCTLPTVLQAQEVVLPEIILPEPVRPAGTAENPLLSARTKGEIISLADRYFRNNNFKGLEEAAALWRRNKTRFPDGSWKLTYLYDAFSQISTSTSGRQWWLDKTRQWIQHSPTSVTPRIVLATVYYQIAWQTYFNDGDVKQGAELLSQARLTLREAKTLEEKCPQWWAITLKVGRLQDWDKATFDAVFNEAIAFEPEYNPFYFHKSRYLASLSEAETAKFCQEAADQRGGESGDILYALLMHFLSDYTYDTVHSPEFSFERMDRGYQAMDRLTPRDLDLKVAWVNLCGYMHHNAPARRARIRQQVSELEKLQPSRTARWRWTVKRASDWAHGTQNEKNTTGHDQS